MKTVGLFVKPPGTHVHLKTSPGSGILTYVVFIQGWTSTGKKPMGTWHSGDLEATGRTLVLDDIRGYDLILKAIVSADTTITATLSFDGVARAAQTEALPAAEGPVVVREWSIVVR